MIKKIKQSDREHNFSGDILNSIFDASNNELKTLSAIITCSKPVNKLHKCAIIADIY